MNGKRKSGLGVIWIPGRSRSSRHKYRTIEHASEKRHPHQPTTDRFRPLPSSAYDNYSASVSSDMMSGDSTLPAGTQLKIDTELPPAPPISTAQDKSNQSGEAAAILLDQAKPATLSITPPAIPGHHDDNDEPFSTKDSGSQTPDENTKDTKLLVTNSLDNVDAIYKPNNNIAKPGLEEDQESEKEECLVKCLYYAIQCCECNLQ